MGGLGDQPPVLGVRVVRSGQDSCALANAFTDMVPGISSDAHTKQIVKSHGQLNMLVQTCNLSAKAVDAWTLELKKANGAIGLA